MKKILLSILTIGLVASVAFGATRAFFSDTATSAITFTSGTVDLVLSKDNGNSWHDGLNFNLPNNWAPGDTFSIEVWSKNVGTSGLKNLFVTGNNLGGVGAFSNMINITDVAYTDTVGWVHPAGGTYYGTVFGDTIQPFTLGELASGLTDGKKMNFCWGDCETQGDYLPADEGRTQRFFIEFTFDENASDWYQGKSVSFDLMFKGTDESMIPVWTP